MERKKVKDIIHKYIRLVFILKSKKNKMDLIQINK